MISDSERVRTSVILCCCQHVNTCFLSTDNSLTWEAMRKRGIPPLPSFLWGFDLAFPASCDVLVILLPSVSNGLILVLEEGTQFTGTFVGALPDSEEEMDAV